MIDSNAILMVLNSLDSSTSSFKSTIDKFIKLGIKIANEIDEFREELEIYEDRMFHIYIKDLDYNIWLKKIGSQISYNNSYYEENLGGSMGDTPRLLVGMSYFRRGRFPFEGQDV